jgi:hypothetical protein
MRKLFEICTLAVAACAVMAPAAQALKDMPITSGTVIDNCGGDLQFGIPGTYGCTICNDSITHCTDYFCNLNPFNGYPGGCNAATVFVRRGQPSPKATPMQFWAPGWLTRNVTR